MKSNCLRKIRTQILTINNCIDQAMLQRKFSCLKTIRKRLFNSVLNNSTTRKTNQGMGLRYNDVAQHCKRRRNATRGWVSDNRNIRQASFTMAFFKTTV